MRNVYSILRIGLVLLYGVSIFYSCSALKDNYKALQKCKFQVLSLETLKAELISFPPVPKIVFLAKVEITNPNETEVTLHKFDLSFSFWMMPKRNLCLREFNPKRKSPFPLYKKKRWIFKWKPFLKKKWTVIFCKLR